MEQIGGQLRNMISLYIYNLEIGLNFLIVLKFAMKIKLLRKYIRNLKLIL